MFLYIWNMWLSLAKENPSNFKWNHIDDSIHVNNTNYRLSCILHLLKYRHLYMCYLSSWTIYMNNAQYSSNPVPLFWFSVKFQWTSLCCLVHVFDVSMVLLAWHCHHHPSHKLFHRLYNITVALAYMIPRKKECVGEHPHNIVQNEFRKCEHDHRQTI